MMGRLLVCILALLVLTEAADARHHRKRTNKPKAPPAKVAPVPAPPVQASSPPAVNEPLRQVMVRTVSLGLYFPAWQAEDRWPVEQAEPPADLLIGLLNSSAAAFAPTQAQAAEASAPPAAAAASAIAALVLITGGSFLTLAGAVPLARRRRGPTWRRPPRATRPGASPGMVDSVSHAAGNRLNFNEAGAARHPQMIRRQRSMPERAPVSRCRAEPTFDPYRVLQTRK